jgi:hypothetical protein
MLAEHGAPRAKSENGFYRGCHHYLGLALITDSPDIDPGASPQPNPLHTTALAAPEALIDPTTALAGHTAGKPSMSASFVPSLSWGLRYSSASDESAVASVHACYRAPSTIEQSKCSASEMRWSDP